MKIRLFTIALILCLFFSMTVRADVIWEPEDGFYRKHAEQCDYYARSHIVNSPDGGLALYKSPESKSVVTTAENGTVLYISFTYDNGAWGVVEFSDGATAWIEMGQTVLKYDNASFMDAYSAAFFEDEEAVKMMLENLTEEDLLYDYSYPGSGPTQSYIPAKYVLENENFSLQSLFVDENGRLWGYVGYFMGRRGWVCVSDPTNSELPVIERQQLELYPAKGIDVPKAMDTGTLAAVLVGGVAVVSLVLLLVLRKKKGAESWNNTQPITQKPKTLKGRMKSLQCTGWRGDDRDFEA